MKLIRSVCAAFLLLNVTAVLAQGVRDPNNGRGFDPGKLYSFSGIDAVNTFNGNLVLRLPIGQSYPVSSSLSYQLMLTYNSKVWDYVFIDYSHPGITGQYHRRAIPERESNAGLGWRLSLGQILPPQAGTPTTPDVPWTYVAADGSRHVIGGNNHYTETAPNWAIGYTDDGSYIRVKHRANEHVLEFPDGEVHTFDALGRLTRITDRFDNYVAVQYVPTSTGAEWRITDGHSSSGVVRTHVIEFETVSQSYPDNPNFRHRIKKVSMAAFAAPGETAAQARAEYVFDYLDTTIARGSCGARLDGLPETAEAALLRAIDLPDGTSYEMEYNTSDLSATCQSGTIRKLLLPTLGTISWKHGPYELPAPECSLEPMPGDAGRRLWSYEQVGVLERTFDPGGGADVLRWTYSPELKLEPSTQIKCGDVIHPSMPGPPRVFTNTVVNPSGQKTRYFFSAFNAELLYPTAEQLLIADDYGLPFVRSMADGDLFLSSETFDASVTQNPPALRRTFVKFERDTFPNGLIPGAVSTHHRLIAERADYPQDQGCGGVCRAETRRTDYDGYGNDRTVTVSSNFGPTRTTKTDHNKSGSGTRTIGPGDAWILNVYSEQSVTESGDGNVAASTRTVRVCIDPNTGALKGRRMQKETYPGVHDVIVRYGRDTRGNPASEDWYGGDESSLLSGDLCSAMGAGDSEYQILRTFESGALKTSKHRGMTFFDADYTIDANTGMASVSRDSSEQPTAFLYDRTSRLTLVTAPDGTSTEYEYRSASQLHRAAVLIEAGPTSTGTKRLVEFDGLGRMRSDGELMPSGVWSYKYTQYDAAGRVKRQTELGDLPEGSLPHTTFTYDLFDRLATASMPDFSVVQETYTGHGVRAKRRTSSVKLPNGHTQIPVDEVYDALGRLVEVAEHSGPTTAASAMGTRLSTHYSYDAGDQLRLVRMVGNDNAQTRIFDYDGRGFLRWEMQPESGVAAYTYDSRGNVRTKSMGATASPYDLDYRYDQAERLETLWGRNPLHTPGGTEPLFRLVKQFEYEDTFGDFGKGRLRKATRFNYPPVGVTAVNDRIVKVVDVYWYGDARGMPTERDTQIHSNLFSMAFTLHKTVRTALTYDDYGKPDRIEYPISVGAVIPDNLTAQYTTLRGRTIGVSNVHGGVPFVQSITYHPNGMRDTILHGNGMQDIQEVDFSGIPRPRRMISTAATSCTAPAITQQPTGKKIVAPATTAQLTVVATASPAPSYQWYVLTGSSLSSATPVPNEVNATFNAPNTNARYFVRITNACRSVDSVVVEVTTTTCPTVSMLAQRTINKDGTVTLTAFPSGSGPMACTWYRTSDGAAVATGAQTVVPAAVGLQSLQVRATSDCDGVVAQAFLSAITQVQVTGGLQALVHANRQSIAVSWPAIAGIQTYELTRRGGTGGPVLFTVSGTSYVDTAVSPNSAYVYTLGGNVLSNADVATTFAFTTIVSGGEVRFSYMTEILNALNAIRALGGWQPLTWQTIMPPSAGVPAFGGAVHAVYYSALRPRMDEALLALGAPVTPYSDPDPRLAEVRAIHMTELQRRAQ